jgi:glucose/arabinose dehydrogenase
MLITERGGRVLAAAPGSSDTRVLLEPPSDLRVSGQSGLLGIAVDPNFTTNRFIYVFMASTRSGSTDNRIRRFRLNDDSSALIEDRDILTGITWGADGGHSGGRLRFGPDGHLWITTGDTRSATVPQDLDALGGKVLRITRDGEPAPGNPSIAGARPEIYFVGVRNPQGLAFRPGSGTPFICEHGPNQDDEVTRLVAGGNGGWNPNDGAGNYNGYSGALMSDPSIPNLVQPSYRVSNSEGMSGCDFLVGTQWRAWDRALLVGMLAGARALVVPLDAPGTGTTGPVSNTLASGDRLRAIVQGPDGFLYVALDSEPGVIWRVSAD